MILDESYILKNGIQIPKLGFGTWFINDADAAKVVCDAVSVGYRHIDTAQAYNNERGVGEGIRKSSSKRENIFVTTKLAAEIKTYSEALEAVDESLLKMGLDYIDMMLIHSPEPWDDFRGGNYDEGNCEAWRALEDSYKSGKLRAIGISNFRQSDINNLLSNCTVQPMVNQLLIHISNTPHDLIEYSRSKEMVVEAYSPIAHGTILKNKLLSDIAAKYGVTVPQLCIRYALQLETLPLPKTVSRKHMKENVEIDFNISYADMDALKNIEHIKDYGEFSVFPVFSGK